MALETTNIMPFLPSLNSTAWLAERKTLFGTRILTQVDMFGGDGNDLTAPHFIWKVEKVVFQIYMDAAVRHYSFIKAASAKNLVVADYLSRDRILNYGLEKEKTMVPNKVTPPANIFWQAGQSAAGTQDCTELCSTFLSHRHDRNRMDPQGVQLVEKDFPANSRA